MRSTRYIVYGPGAIGGTIAVELAANGADVAVVARGPHADAIELGGLLLATPAGTLRAELRVARHPAELDVRATDVVLLCVKSGDTEAAVRDLAALGQSELPVVCMQNGVCNEGRVQEVFEHVYGAMLWMPTTHLEPGRVIAYGDEALGHAVVGRAAGGVDELCQQLVADFSDCRLRAQHSPEVMRWKRGKLLCSLGNAVDALCFDDGHATMLAEAAMSEGKACLEAAGLSYVEPDVLIRETAFALLPVAGVARPGGSTWQSLERRRGATEVPAFNGWICELGAKLGCATPINRALLELASRVAAERGQPRRVASATMAREVGLLR